MPPIAARSPSVATKFSDIGNAAGDAAGAELSSSAPVLTDAVEKIANDLDEPFHLSILGSVFVSVFVSFLLGLARRGQAVLCLPV
jgi:hypothetical protein